MTTQHYVARVCIVALALTAFACRTHPPHVATTPAAVQPAAAAAAVPNLYDAERVVDEYISSGRYEADVATVVSEARAWLDTRAKTATKPAIVLDIDETSLSNWRAYRANDWARVLHGPCDVERGPCGIRAWQGMGQATALALAEAGADCFGAERTWRRCRNAMAVAPAPVPDDVHPRCDRCAVEPSEGLRVSLLADGYTFIQSEEFQQLRRRRFRGAA